jgi:hypothetical protein
MHSFLLLAAFAAAVFARNVPHHSAKHQASLPSTFSWTSSDILVTPKNDSRAIAGIKDPSIIQYKGHYHVFASTAKDEGYNLVYFNFTSFEMANAAPFYYLDQSAIGTGYRAAPEVCT